jgi:hypothetical protein
MKFGKRYFYLAVFLAIALVFSAADMARSETQEITPTDVYYLAHSIDDSLVAMYDLKTVFRKNRFSENIKPRSSYQKLMNTLEEFGLIHGNVFTQSQLEELSKISPAEIKPTHLFQALTLMKNYLVEKGAFQEFKGERTPKQPRDVLYMLRQISFHHLEIAKKKNLTTDWGTPARVYEALVNDILPVLMKAADDVGLKYKEYAFPKQPTEEVSPWNVIKLLRHLYTNISQYHAAKVKYEPLVLNEITDCDEISPADVFDMLKIIAAEFRFAAGTKTLKPEISKRYIAWKGSQSKILPGHVYRLLQYSFVLSKDIVEKMGEKK